MMISKAKLGLLVVIPLVLVACQSTGGGREDLAEILEQAAMLESLNMSIGGEARNLPGSGFSIKDWNPIDDKNLLITSGVDGYFLVTFREPCEQLRYARTIYFDARGPVLGSGDSVVATTLGGTQQRCQIEGIFELVPKEGVGE